jgi:hypothetical protein
MATSGAASVVPSVPVRSERRARRGHRGRVRRRGECGTGDQCGQCESSDKHFHDTSPSLDHCPDWTSAPRPIVGRLGGMCEGVRFRAVTGITAFRTIQNDSERSDWPASAKSLGCEPSRRSFRPQLSGGVAAGLRERGGKPFKNVGPVAARLLHKFRFCRVRQAEFAPGSACIQFNGYALKI